MSNTYSMVPINIKREKDKEHEIFRGQEGPVYTLHAVVSRSFTTWLFS